MHPRNVLIPAVAGVLALGAASQLHAYSYATPAAHATSAMHAKIVATEKSGKYLFSPIKDTVKKGTQVTWKNTSDAPHTVTGKGNWSSYNKQLPARATVSFTFRKAGTYHYFCSIHPYMKATVIVR